MKKLYLAILVTAIAIGIFSSVGTQATSCDAYTGSCPPWDPDSDQDGLCNSYENTQSHTNPFMLDTDNGGACDGDEVLLDGTDPKYPDDDSM